MWRKSVLASEQCNLHLHKGQLCSVLCEHQSLQRSHSTNGSRLARERLGSPPSPWSCAACRKKAWTYKKAAVQTLERLESNHVEPWTHHLGSQKTDAASLEYSVQVGTGTCMWVQTDCFCAVALCPRVPILWCDPPQVRVAKPALIQYFWTGSVLCFPSDDLPLLLLTGIGRLCSCSHSYSHCFLLIRIWGMPHSSLMMSLKMSKLAELFSLFVQ